MRRPVASGNHLGEIEVIGLFSGGSIQKGDLIDLAWPRTLDPKLSFLSHHVLEA